VVASRFVRPQEQSDPQPRDDDLLARLRSGDERAFAELVRQHHDSLIRLARPVVSSQAVAEEVAQETWFAVIRGLPGFRGGSSLRTWIVRILLRTAQNRAARERRSLPFSALSGADSDEGPTVDPARFRPPGDPWAGFWSSPPQAWWTAPEPQAMAAETGRVVAEALQDLPPAQAQVVRLRDVEGWSGAEVCAALGLTEANQRVLLHRGRAKLRAALEDHFAEGVRS
jgi:RNA polymerase sigma-70 factor (ECF subfamily)